MAAAYPASARECELAVDAAGRSSPLPAHWKRLLNVGYARSLTDAGIQGQLRRLQEKVGFEFFRVKGVLDDDMCLLRLDMNGNAVMNYAYLDEGLDFILSLGARPMLELGFMPSLLAKDAQARSMRGSLVSQPKEISHWRELIKRLMAHFVERYGSRTVALWLFSPWLSPDFIDMGLCGREEYAQVYSASYHAIRDALPNALIVGPGSTSFAAVWPWFLDMCRQWDCMPDILSFRAFATVVEGEEDGMKLVGNNESFPFAVSGDEDYLAHMTRQIRSVLRAEGLADLPLILEEWSNNIWQRDLCNDTCYKSAYLFKNILENNGTLGAMGYFALNDRLDEIPPAREPFHGGFGLFTQDGIPKSACLALELLACPQYHSERMKAADGELHIRASLAPQDVWLIRIGR